MINKLQNLQHGDQLIYHTGDTQPPFDIKNMVADLYNRKRITMVQRLVKRVPEPNGMGTFEYIAIGIGK